MKNLNLYPKTNRRIHPSSLSSVESVLNRLPAVILTIVSVIGSEDREVLAYFILRSMENPSSVIQNKCKNLQNKPFLDCGCFDCYCKFMIRWDSSPNHDRIHQVIDAFEDHLSNTETPKKNVAGKNRKKDGRKDGDTSEKMKPVPEPETGTPEMEEGGSGELVTGYRLQPVAAVQELPGIDNRGLVRKVWPGVLGLLNSRLWSHWNPNA